MIHEWPAGPFARLSVHPQNCGSTIIDICAVASRMAKTVLAAFSAFVAFNFASASVFLSSVTFAFRAAPFFFAALSFVCVLATNAAAFFLAFFAPFFLAAFAFLAVFLAVFLAFALAFFTFYCS